MSSCNEKALTDLLVRLNKSLKYYEEGYSSVKRTPNEEKERCRDFKHYIEMRLNYEACSVPELSYLVLLTGGNFFKCTNITNDSSFYKRFESVEMSIEDAKTQLSGDETLKDELNRALDFLGGTIIRFNSLKVKIKYEILN